MSGRVTPEIGREGKVVAIVMYEGLCREKMEEMKMSDGNWDSERDL